MTSAREVAAFHDDDVALLIGSSLQTGSPDLEANARALRQLFHP